MLINSVHPNSAAALLQDGVSCGIASRRRSEPGLLHTRRNHALGGMLAGEKLVQVPADGNCPKSLQCLRLNLAHALAGDVE